MPRAPWSLVLRVTNPQQRGRAGGCPDPADPRRERPPDVAAAGGQPGRGVGHHHSHLVNQVVQLSWLFTHRDGTTYTLRKEKQYKLLMIFNSCQ